MVITVTNGNDGEREIGPIEEKTGGILKEDRAPLHQVALRKTHKKTGWLEENSLPCKTTTKNLKNNKNQIKTSKPATHQPAFLHCNFLLLTLVKHIKIVIMIVRH